MAAAKPRTIRNRQQQKKKAVQHKKERQDIYVRGIYQHVLKTHFQGNHNLSYHKSKATKFNNRRHLHELDKCMKATRIQIAGYMFYISKNLHLKPHGHCVGCAATVSVRTLLHS